jgi:BarA-like signal transduction histidine kinase
MAMDHHWPNVLIVEDDLQFINQNNFSQLQDLMRKPYDVILLGATFAKRDPQTSRVKNAQTATAYVVHEN